MRVNHQHGGRRAERRGVQGDRSVRGRKEKQTALIWNIHSLPSAFKKHKLSLLEKMRGEEEKQKNTNKPQTKHLLIRLRHWCKAILCSYIIINFFFVLKLWALIFPLSEVQCRAGTICSVQLLWVFHSSLHTHTSFRLQPSNSHK